MIRISLKSLGFLAILSATVFTAAQVAFAQNQFISDPTGSSPAATSPLVKSGVANISAQTASDDINLIAGKAQVVAIKGKVSDIIVSNPSLLEVGPVKDGQVYMIGTGPGTTNVLVMGAGGDLLRQINVTINIDTSIVEKNIKKEFPDANVSVEAAGNQIQLQGSVADAKTAARIKDVASRFVPDKATVVNNLTVSDGQQVMLRVKIVEVSRNLLNELGLETDVSNVSKGNFSIANQTGAAATATANPAFGLSIDPSFGNGSLIYSSTGTGPINLLIHALERDGLVNTLAQPNLTAISGENARFLAGGEFPIPSARDTNGNIIYEYHPFGVSLAFKPIVIDKNRINLQVATEVSEISTENTLQLPGVTVPSFNVRRAETTVELASGGSLMLAGLISANTIERMNGLPGIKDVPVLGALMRSESFTRNESELLVMITAYLVQPVADKQADHVVDPVKRTEPLNVALAQSLALSYGNVVNNYAKDAPFGFIME